MRNGSDEKSLLTSAAAVTLGRVHQMLSLVLIKDVLVSSEANSLSTFNLERDLISNLGRDSAGLIQYMSGKSCSDILKLTSQMRWLSEFRQDDFERLRKISVLEGLWLINQPQRVLKAGVLKSLKAGYKNPIALADRALYIDSLRVLQSEVYISSGVLIDRIPDGGFNLRLSCFREANTGDDSLSLPYSGVMEENFEYVLGGTNQRVNFSSAGVVACPARDSAFTPGCEMGWNCPSDDEAELPTTQADTAATNGQTTQVGHRPPPSAAQYLMWPSSEQQMVGGNLPTRGGRQNPLHVGWADASQGGSGQSRMVQGTESRGHWVERNESGNRQCSNSFFSATVIQPSTGNTASYTQYQEVIFNTVPGYSWYGEEELEAAATRVRAEIDANRETSRRLRSNPLYGMPRVNVMFTRSGDEPSSSRDVQELSSDDENAPNPPENEVETTRPTTPPGAETQVPELGSEVQADGDPQVEETAEESARREEEEARMATERYRSAPRPGEWGGEESDPDDMSRDWVRPGSEPPPSSGAQEGSAPGGGGGSGAAGVEVPLSPTVQQRVEHIEQTSSQRSGSFGAARKFRIGSYGEGSRMESEQAIGRSGRRRSFTSRMSAGWDRVRSSFGSSSSLGERGNSLGKTHRGPEMDYSGYGVADLLGLTIQEFVYGNYKLSKKVELFKKAIQLLPVSTYGDLALGEHLRKCTVDMRYLDALEDYVEWFEGYQDIQINEYPRECESYLRYISGIIDDIVSRDMAGVPDAVMNQIEDTRIRGMLESDSKSVALRPLDLTNLRGLNIHLVLKPAWQNAAKLWLKTSTGSIPFIARRDYAWFASYLDNNGQIEGFKDVWYAVKGGEMLRKVPWHLLTAAQIKAFVKLYSKLKQEVSCPMNATAAYTFLSAKDSYNLEGMYMTRAEYNEAVDELLRLKPAHRAALLVQLYVTGVELIHPQIYAAALAVTEFTLDRGRTPREIVTDLNARLLQFTNVNPYQ
jgi:hypothetical protein